MYFSVNLSLVYHSVMNVMISRSMRMFPTSPSLLLSSPTPLQRHLMVCPTTWYSSSAPLVFWFLSRSFFKACQSIPSRPAPVGFCDLYGVPHQQDRGLCVLYRSLLIMVSRLSSVFVGPFHYRLADLDRLTHLM